MMLHHNEAITNYDGIDVSVVRSIDELFCVSSIRARVYQNEQNCPYSEEFDGNDVSGATHLLAKKNGEPIGTIRLRWFADFMKAERIAVVEAERAGSAVFALMYASCLMGQRKGYRTMIGHAERRVARFWKRTGIATPRADRSEFGFSGQRFVEVECDIEQTADRLGINADPMVINRPEGQWDTPGILEAGAAQ